MMMTRIFDSKVAVITGSASGIGRATAIAFAAQGAIVVGGDINSAGGEETAELCRAQGVESAFVNTDVTEQQQVERLLAKAVDQFGGLDILYNNACFTGAIGPLETIPVEDWDKSLAIGLRSVFLGIRTAVPLMRARGGGSIISTASMAARRGVRGLPAYCAGKAGVVSLTQSAAIELAEEGIRVNCVCPGDILTPMRASPISPAEMEAQLARLQPIQRAGMPEDVAQAVLFLASDAAGFITGIALDVDGGALAGLWNYGGPSQHAHVRNQGFLGPSFLRTSGPAETAVETN
jgi:NAD(P)-dependent dehydrogenase (short-subunit alcohol dehydrogenase family)